MLHYKWAGMCIGRIAKILVWHAIIEGIPSYRIGPLMVNAVFVRVISKKAVPLMLPSDSGGRNWGVLIPSFGA